MKRQTEKNIVYDLWNQNIFQVFLEFAVFLRDSFEYLSFYELSIVYLVVKLLIM